MVSYDTECAFAIVWILKGTIPLQILIFLYFLSVLLIFVRSSYTAFRWGSLAAARRAGRLAGMRKESRARSRLPPDYAAAPVCLPSCSPLSLKLCGETGELVCRFPGSGFLPDRNSISDSWHARVIRRSWPASPKEKRSGGHSILWKIVCAEFQLPQKW